MVKAKGKRVPRLRRNYQLAPGVMRFSSSRMYSKRGLFIRKRYPVVVKTIEKKKKFVVKPIGGEKNGGERKVPIKKKVSSYYSYFFVDYFRIIALLKITGRICVIQRKMA